MLEITVPGGELFNEVTNEFIPVAGAKLQLEHSLLSISKWEVKWKKPFISDKGKTPEECRDYVRCMCFSRNVDPNVYLLLTETNMREVNAYIEDPMTATTVKDERGGPRSREIVTSEVIYYWMTALQIPFECEKWNLNRLLMLVRVCNAKNNPGKKIKGKELANQNRALNAARKNRMKTHG